MKRIQIIISVLIFSCLILDAQVEDQMSPSEIKQMTVVTEPATLYKGFFRAGLIYNHGLAKKAFDPDGNRITLDGNGYLQTRGLGLLLQYGITKRIQVNVHLPYYMDIRQLSNIYEDPTLGIKQNLSSEQKGYGLGDVSIGAYGQLLRKTENLPSITARLTYSIPTGQKDITNVKDVWNYDLPTGSGESSIALDLQLRKVLYPISLVFRAGTHLRFGGEKIFLPGGESTSFKGGPSIFFDGGFNFHLNEWMSMGNELRYQSIGKDTYDGIKADDNGSFFAYQPSFQFQIKQFRLFQTMQVPLFGKRASASPDYILGVQYISENMKRYFILLSFTLFLLTACKTPSILVTEEQRLGDQYNNQHKYEQAIVHYKNSLAASAKLGVYRNLDMEADVCRKISHAYQVQGQYDEAVEYIGYALNKDSIQGNTLGMIEDYRDLGEIHIYKGDFASGISYLEKALEMNEGMDSSLKGQNQLSIADTYLSLAQVNNVLGRFRKSQEYCESALSIYKRLNDPKGRMEALLLLGNIHINAGMPGTAKEMVQESMELAAEDNLSTARQLSTLAEIYTATGELEKALSHNVQALDQAKKSRIVPQIIWMTMRVGDTYRDIGDTKEALSYYTSAREMQDSSGMQALALQASSDARLGNVEQAQQYFLSIGSDVGGGLATLKIAEMQAEAGQTDAALKSYSQAITLFDRSGVAEGAAQGYIRKADLLLTSGTLAPEPEILGQALEAISSAQKLAQYPENQWQVWYHKGRYAEIVGNPDTAIAHYDRSIQIIEEIRGNFTIDDLKSKYIEEKVKVYDRLIRLLIERGDFQSAFSYAERAKARAFLDLIGSKKLQVGDAPGHELIEKEQDLRMQIQSLTKKMQQNELGGTRGMSTREVYAELHRSQQEYSRLLQRIKLENAEYHSMVNIEPVDANEVAGNLEEETALLYYWIGEQYSTAWIFTKDGMFTQKLELNAAGAKRLVDYCRQMVRRTAEFRGGGDWESEVQLPVPEQSAPVSAREQFSKAYVELISPIYSQLKGYTNIGIVPHGPLHFLPFQALISPDGSFLVEDHNLFYIPSSSVYEQCLQKSGDPKNRFIGMALGDLELGTFSGLPGTKWELEQISSQFPGETFTYEESTTETYFKQNAGSYEYIHLATHGMMNNKQPVFSFMLMNPTEEDDGQLTVNEVFGMNLQARLVTLSACETGLGDLSQGDEVVGLSRAFIYAGSPSVIVSLWSVADQPTAELMASFYRHLMDNPPYKALSMAQREVMQKFRAPFYWAPFQLIGTGM